MKIEKGGTNYGSFIDISEIIEVSKIYIWGHSDIMKGMRIYTWDHKSKEEEKIILKLDDIYSFN